MMMAKASTDRVVDILRQHEKRLAPCLGEGQTDETEFVYRGVAPSTFKIRRETLPESG
jgi:hypothetical protein